MAAVGLLIYVPFAVVLAVLNWRFVVRYSAQNSLWGRLVVIGVFATVAGMWLMGDALPWQSPFGGIVTMLGLLMTLFSALVIRRRASKAVARE
jgi:hypothetical protein